MKKNNYFVRSALFIVLTLFLNSNIVFGKNTLWKITSKTNTLYLQGSVHMLKANDYPLDPAIEQAYTKSSTVFFEVDLGKMNEINTQKKLLKKTRLPAGESFQKYLNTATFERLKKAIQKEGIPIEIMKIFKPWFVVVTLTIIKTQKLGFSSKKGLDNYFFKKAVADKKKIIPLETISFQFSLFDDLSKEDPNAFINYSLDDLDQLVTTMEKIRTSWKTGNLKILEQILTQSINKYPNLKKRFLTDRNKQWEKRLIAQLKTSETTMVIVGAAHLVGKEGLIELLRKKGYKVEQL